MEIEYIAIDAIKPYERNPRKNDAAVDSVAASIREFGFQQPIMCDTDGVIIVGHTRLKAAKKLGLKTVPVVYADLPEDKVKAYLSEAGVSRGKVEVYIGVDVLKKND